MAAKEVDQAKVLSLRLKINNVMTVIFLIILFVPLSKSGGDPFIIGVGMIIISLLLVQSALIAGSLQRLRESREQPQVLKDAQKKEEEDNLPK